MGTPRLLGCMVPSSSQTEPLAHGPEQRHHNRYVPSGQIHPAPTIAGAGPLSTTPSGANHCRCRAGTDHRRCQQSHRLTMTISRVYTSLRQHWPGTSDVATNQCTTVQQTWQCKVVMQGEWVAPGGQAAKLDAVGVKGTPWTQSQGAWYPATSHTNLAVLRLLH
jgi:hypothetical protein